MSGFQLVDVTRELIISQEYSKEGRLALDYHGNKKLLKTNLEALKMNYTYVVNQHRANVQSELIVTSTERAFQKIFRSKFRYKTYQTFQIGPFNVDMFCPKINAYIEIDGGIHNSEGKMKKDYSRLNQLTSKLNLHELRFTNEQVLSAPEYVLGIISGVPVLSDYQANLVFKRVMLSTIRTLL